ncbi:hypothetical protein IC582_017948 [Cucumis melo]
MRPIAPSATKPTLLSSSKLRLSKRERAFSWRLGSSEPTHLRTAETAPDSVNLRRTAESRFETLAS